MDKQIAALIGAILFSVTLSAQTISGDPAANLGKILNAPKDEPMRAGSGYEFQKTYNCTNTSRVIICKPFNAIQLPQKIILIVPTDQLFVNQTVQFTPQAKQTLDAIIKEINHFSQKNIRVTVNTDAVGANIQYEGANLSMKQAEHIAAYLWQNGAYDPVNPRVIYMGVKDLEPISTNQTLAGLKNNRRVQIEISDKPIPTELLGPTLRIYDPSQKYAYIK